MDEKQNRPFQLSFNASLIVDLYGSRVISDGGLILVRKLDGRLGIGELITQHLTESRQGKNTKLQLEDALHQSLYNRIAGYENGNDVERLSQDPTFRLVCALERAYCSAATLRRILPLPTYSGLKMAPLWMVRSMTLYRK